MAVYLRLRRRTQPLIRLKCMSVPPPCAIPVVHAPAGLLLVCAEPSAIVVGLRDRSRSARSQSICAEPSALRNRPCRLGM